VIADPLFFLLAIIAVILLGLSKGGFFGLGVMALPLMSLSVPPLQAAAIILPTVLAQDALTVWSYRREWSPWNLKIMIPSMAAGIAVAGLFIFAWRSDSSPACSCCGIGLARASSACRRGLEC
jgi:uncharacterized membrane protein YfcA